MAKQDTRLRHHAVQCKAKIRRARANTFPYASLFFRSDSWKPATNTSEKYCSVPPTVVAHVGQKQFVHNRTAQASNPTKSSFQHAKVYFTSSSETNKSVSELLRLNDACASDATSAYTLPPESEGRSSESMVQSSSLSSVPILVLFRRGLLNPLWIHLTSSAVALVCCHCEAAHPWKTRELIPRTALFMGGKRQSSKALHRTNESKELEATLIPQSPSKHQGC